MNAVKMQGFLDRPKRYANLTGFLLSGLSIGFADFSLRLVLPKGEKTGSRFSYGDKNAFFRNGTAEIWIFCENMLYYEKKQGSPSFGRVYVWERN